MARPTTATIDLDAIRNNYQYAKQLAPGARALAIVKANAYGHGAPEVAQALQNEADGFGVACIEEALQLRESGVNKPILLLEGFFEADELPLIADQQLWTAIHSAEQVEQLARVRLSRPVNVWLKTDLGMHRLGVSPSEYETLYNQIKELDQVSEVISMGHFPSADDPNTALTGQQISLMRNLTGTTERPVSLANSAACLGHQRAASDWQRPGLMLYGASPFSNDQPLARKLQPAMTLSSKIIAVREIDAGESVGYSATWTASRRSRIATVAIGYADGYPRHARSGTPVLVANQRARLTGRVSMDMLSIDITDIPQAGLGSEVELWGKNLLAAEVAEYADTIPYTLFTGITARVHKSYRSVADTEQ